MRHVLMAGESTEKYGGVLEIKKKEEKKPVTSYAMF